MTTQIFIIRTIIYRKLDGNLKYKWRSFKNVYFWRFYLFDNGETGVNLYLYLLFLEP